MKKKILALLLAVTTAALPFQGRAGMIATGAAADRAAVGEFVQRVEVRRQLVALGADPIAVEKRVAALTDEEAAALAQEIRSVPAGADAGPGLVLFLLIVIVGFIYCMGTMAMGSKERPSLCVFPTRE